MEGTRPIASVERALAVLDVFQDGEPTITLPEFEAATGLGRPTILRILSTLEQQGFIVGTPSGEFHVAAKPLLLANRYHQYMQPSDIVVPVLRELVEQTQESASYIIPHEDVRVSLYRVHSPLPVRDHGAPGDIAPLNRGAAGHIFKAFASAAPQDDPLRERLVAVTRGELHAGMTGMASPVFDATDACVGAVGLTGPTSRFTSAAIARWEPILLQAAAKLTVRFGGSSRFFARAVGAAR